MSESSITVKPSLQHNIQTAAKHPLNQQLSGKSLSDSLFNGFTISLLEAPWWIAMLALVFSGPLSAYLDQAATYLIAGAIISMTITSFFSSWKGVIWLPQDVPTAILVLISTQLVSHVATDLSTESLFMTMVATIAIASLLTGIFMFTLGTLRLGTLVHRIPFPVLAGFLGGTGCLLILGGIDSSLGEQRVGNMFSLNAIMQWLPCIVLALAIYWLGLRIKHAIFIPLMMIGATINFFLIAWYLEIPIDALQQNGWLFTAESSATINRDLLITDHPDMIQWSAIFSQAHSLLALAFASSLAMLLNNSGFSLAVKRNFDHNRDLRNAGIANMCASLVGGWPGYMSPAWSAINARQGRQLPLTGFIVAIITGLLLWHATQLLSYVPRFVIGSAIAYVGVCFLFEWVILPMKRLSWFEYGTLLLVTTAAVVFGLMEAVVAGLGITTVQKQLASYNES
ncbi:MAG: SulP family inorganic anion transporter [Thiolinea sp.]